MVPENTQPLGAGADDTHALHKTASWTVARADTVSEVPFLETAKLARVAPVKTLERVSLVSVVILTPVNVATLLLVIS